MNGKLFGRKRRFYAPIRIDEKQVAELRRKVFKNGLLFVVAVVVLRAIFTGIGSAAEVAASQVLVDSEYLSSLESQLTQPDDLAQTKSVDVGGTAISLVFTKEVQYWANDITRWANEYDLDANLVAAVMQIESCGDPDVISPAGANGLFQVMSFHFGAQEDRLDPETNARRGLSYLKRGLELSSGDIFLALGGYNGGHSVIGNLGLWSDETTRYVYWGTGILEDIKAGNGSNPHLDEWLSAGGISLCRRAAENLGF